MHGTKLPARKINVDETFPEMLQKLQIYCNIIQADQNKRSIVIIELT